MRRRFDETLETPIASLIDVVFLLIIFFVVTAVVEKDVVDESIRLAQAKHVAAIDQKDPRTVTINVTEKGDVNIALQPLNLTQLQQILTATRKQSGDSVPIVIRGDGRTVYGHIDGVMQAVGRTGLYRVRLAAEATGRGDQ
ncbi:MAG: biopolymer transporter ExbD [Lentisphaeria bacterium]|nr:biopolymer transporter ExbD [Lentisphaeria bacterium]